MRTIPCCICGRTVVYDQDSMTSWRIVLGRYVCPGHWGYDSAPKHVRDAVAAQVYADVEAIVAAAMPQPVHA